MIRSNDKITIRKAKQVIRKTTPAIRRSKTRRYVTIRSPTVKGVRYPSADNQLQRANKAAGHEDLSALPEETAKKLQAMGKVQREEVIRRWRLKQQYHAKWEGMEQKSTGSPVREDLAWSEAKPEREKGVPASSAGRRLAQAKQSQQRSVSRGVRAGSRAAHKSLEKTKELAAFVEAEDRAEQAKQKTVKKMKAEAVYLAKKPAKTAAKELAKQSLAALRALGGAMLGGIGSTVAVVLLPVLIILLCLAVLLVSVFAFGQMGENSGSTQADGMPLYYQYDPKWGSVPYGGGTIASSGCGITSMAMVVSYWTGEEITPDMLVAEWGNQYYVDGIGSNMYAMAAGAKEKFGLEYRDLGNDSNKVMEELQQGHTILASCHAGIFTQGGHIIVLRGLNENGKILVNDPNDNASKDYYNRPFDKSTISANCKYYISMWGEMSLGEGDEELLARLVQCEAGSSWISDKQQRLTASVVLNRVRSPSWPNTIHGVIYQSGQFAPAINGSLEMAVPSSRVIKNVKYVLKNGPVDTQVIFFANFKQGTVKYTFANPYLAEDNKYKYSYFGY